MKQENGKKSKLWLWITLAAVAVVVAAGVIAGILFFNPGEGQVTEPTMDIPQSEIYWNIDRIQYTENSESGLSTREKGADGLYHIRFATQGKVVEKATADKQLVNYIDALNACGLVLDADGLIIEVLDINAFAVETAKGFYVKRFNENALTINSAESMNGLEMVIELSDKVCIMDVRPDTDTLCQSIDLGVRDVVSVYGTEENPNAYIFLSERPPASPLYMRVDQFYDSTTKTTTREPDENGVYTIPFAINGKIEQLKCKDKKVVSTLDAYTGAGQVMGLAFDAEGYISAKIGASTASRTKMLAERYHITAINGNAIEATCIRTSSSDLGKVVNFTYDETTQFVINEEGCGHYIGELLDGPQMNDYICVWVDMDDKAVYVKLERRDVHGVDMYYNPTVFDTNSRTRLTTRTQNSDGYYTFQLVSKGKVITAKTKDTEIAYKMDSVSHQIFGLKIKNGIIKEYYDRNCVSGGTSMGNSYYCTQLTGTLARIASGASDTGYNLMLTPETEIYDVTGASGSKFGAKTTLKEGDRVITARKLSGELTHIFVVDRYRSGCKLYYNLKPMYSTTTGKTTRTPETSGENEGYYVFNMACEGKQVQVKTKSEEIATIIDKQSYPQVASLKVSNGIVKAAYGTLSGSKLKYKAYNNQYVDSISEDKTVNCFTYSGGVRIASSYSYKMAKNCQVYNVSNAYNKFKGEKTTLKAGDKVQCLVDALTKELTHIWIINRGMDTPLYMHVNRIAPENGITTRVPDADGYYSVELFSDGKIKTYRTKSKELMSLVDANASTTLFTMSVKGDIIQKVDSYSSSSRAYNRPITTYDIMGISGKTLSLKKMMPGQSTTGTEKEITYTSKTKIYNVDPYSGSAQFKAAKLKKGDRITVYVDVEGNISYIFVTTRQTRVKGYMAKCSHCSKTVWWEPYTGSFIKTAPVDEVIHYYVPGARTTGSVTAGATRMSDPNAPYFAAVLDMNGKTLTSTSRNFLVYCDLTIMDSVGGGVLESDGSSNGGNILVSGGSLTLRDGVTLRKTATSELAAGTGGNISVQNQVTESGDTHVGSLNIKNAKLEGRGYESAGNIYMNAGTKLTISGGTITGDEILVEKDVTIKLSGSPKILGDGLNLTSGAKISESKLSGSAKVIVRANGIFSKTLSNATAQKAFYEADIKYYPVEVKEGALWTDRNPNVPDFTEEPEIPEKPSVTSVNNAPLSLDAKKQAKCPVCNKVVTWTAITSTDAAQTLADGGHYYLPADVNFTKADYPYIQVASGASACLHLNEHDIIATKSMAVMVKGTLNIMGNGTVSGNGFDNEELRAKPHQTAATLGTDLASAVINLYGGTYIKSAENDDRKVDVTGSTGVVTSTAAANPVVAIYGNGGNINMFEGATIDGRGYKTQTVTVYYGKFNMYGGEVFGGSTHTFNLTAYSSSKTGTASFYGGIVKAGTGSAVNVYGSTSSGSAALNIYGGTLDGNVQYNANCKVVIAGNPVLTGLKQPSSKSGAYEGKITLGKLTDGADISVSGTDAIACPNENAASYKKYFKSLTVGTMIDVVDFAISVVPQPADPDVVVVPGNANMIGVSDATLAQMDKGNAIDHSDAAFAQHLANGTCPICGTGVTWVELGAGQADLAAGTYAATEKMHFYFSDTVATAAGTMFDLSATSAMNQACVWLKSTNNIINNTERVSDIAAGKVLSFYGQGSLTTNNLADSTYKDYEMFRVSGTLTLYGGNFDYANPGTVASSKYTKAAIVVNDAAAEVNIYNGANVGPATKNTDNVTINLLYTAAGKVNMFGGKIRNGVSKQTYSASVNVYAGGIFNMYGGTIEGGSNMKSSSGRGGNLYVDASATVNIHGGTITGGYSAGNGGNIYITNSAATTFNMFGGKVTNGEAVGNGGNFYAWGPATLHDFALVEGGKANNGGNVYIQRYAFTTSGVIRNGEAKTAGGNIGANGAQADLALTVKGGQIYGGKITGNAANGSNIQLLLTSDKAGRKFSITGGTIVGGVVFNAYDADDVFEISGAPQIVLSAEIDGTTQTAEKGIQMSKAQIDITGLTADAKVAITAVKGDKLTAGNTNAASLLGCFSVAGETLEVNGDNEIVVKS